MFFIDIYDNSAIIFVTLKIEISYFCKKSLLK